MRAAKARLQLDAAIQGQDGILEAPLLHADQPQIQKRLGKIRLQACRLGECGSGLIEPAVAQGGGAGAEGGFEGVLLGTGGAGKPLGENQHKDGDAAGPFSAVRRACWSIMDSRVFADFHAASCSRFQHLRMRSHCILRDSRECPGQPR